MRVGGEQCRLGGSGPYSDYPSHVLVAFCNLAHIFKHVNMAGNPGIFCFRPLKNGGFYDKIYWI